MTTVAAIVLAAGSSRRMGERNKLLQEVGGRPLILGVVDAVAQVTDTPPLVVLGHQADAVAEVLAGAPVRLETNLAHAEGQQGTVAYGLQRADPADVTLVVLGDQPLLTAADLRALVGVHVAEGADRITIPVRHDPATGAEARGNPIALSAPRLADVLAQGRNLTCRAFTERNPQAVHRWHTERPGFFTDIDTPADLEAVRSALAPGGAPRATGGPAAGPAT